MTTKTRTSAQARAKRQITASRRRSRGGKRFELVIWESSFDDHYLEACIGCGVEHRDGDMVFLTDPMNDKVPNVGVCARCIKSMNACLAYGVENVHEAAYLEERERIQEEGFWGEDG